MVIVIMLLVLVLRPVRANPCIGCLSLDIWGYSLFHRGLSNVHLHNAKRSFYAAVNGLSGKLLNSASEEVILELVRTKCTGTPILLHELECFQLGKADLHSLDFTFNRLCMKLFKTGSIELVRDLSLIHI